MMQDKALLDKLFVNSERADMACALRLRRNEYRMMMDRVSEDALFATIINKLMTYENYYVVVGRYAIFAVPKQLQSSYMIVSVHYDNVYENSFYTLERNYIHGTLDNAVGIMAAFDVMDAQCYRDVIFAFTDGEEMDCCEAKNVRRFVKRVIGFDPRVYTVLDVSNVPTLTPTTIENIFYDLPEIKSGLTVFEGVYEYMDEAIFYGKCGERAFSVCCAVDSPGMDCHSEKGSRVYIRDYEEYVQNVRYLLNIMR